MGDTYRTPFKIFTQAPISAEFWGGGIIDADNYCNGDSVACLQPDGGAMPCKAMIVDGVNRSAVASEPGFNTWTLAANTPYMNSNGSYVGTTNASKVFPFSLSSAIGGGGNAWTGLNADWSAATDNCSLWTSYTAGNGAVGTPAATTSSSINNGAPLSCADTAMVYCAQQ